MSNFTMGDFIDDTRLTGAFVVNRRVTISLEDLEDLKAYHKLETAGLKELILKEFKYKSKSILMDKIDAAIASKTSQLDNHNKAYRVYEMPIVFRLITKVSEEEKNLRLEPYEMLKVYAITLKDPEQCDVGDFMSQDDMHLDERYFQLEQFNMQVESKSELFVVGNLSKRCKEVTFKKTPSIKMGNTAELVFWERIS